MVGGGASGMFAATAAADYIRRHGMDGCEVVVFEGTSKTMSKVRISGGGRVSAMQIVCVEVFIFNLTLSFITMIDPLKQCNGEML